MCPSGSGRSFLSSVPVMLHGLGWGHGVETACDAAARKPGPSRYLPGPRPRASPGDPLIKAANCPCEGTMSSNVEIEIGGSAKESSAALLWRVSVVRGEALTEEAKPDPSKAGQGHVLLVVAHAHPTRRRRCKRGVSVSVASAKRH